MGRLHALAIGACCAVASCALMTPNSARVYEPRGATQELLVRTDPPGAACSVLQEGAEVAAVAPAAFASEPERDAFFAALSARLEGAAAAQRAVVDATCHYWPCQASDATPCADPMCQRRREWIDGELGIQLELIPGLRSRASVVPATVPQEPP